MPFVNCPQTQDALTADGDANGYVTVTSNANYYPGAHVWMISTTQGSVEFIVTDVSGATKIGLQAVTAMSGGAVYTRTPVTAFTVADSAKIAQVPGVVQVEGSAYVKKPLM